MTTLSVSGTRREAQVPDEMPLLWVKYYRKATAPTSPASRGSTSSSPRRWSSSFWRSGRSSKASAIR